MHLWASNAIRLMDLADSQKIGRSFGRHKKRRIPKNPPVEREDVAHGSAGTGYNGSGLSALGGVRLWAC